MEVPQFARRHKHKFVPDTAPQALHLDLGFVHIGDAAARVIVSCAEALNRNSKSENDQTGAGP